MANPYLSVVIPVYNEQAVLETLYTRLTNALEKLNKTYEVILINDGSKDDSEKILASIYKRRPEQFRIINFGANFGQHMAIMAGLEHVRGEVVVTMDADLQNPPEEIGKLLTAIEQGHDVVNTYRQNRQDKKWRLLVSWLHNFIRAKILLPRIKMKDEGSMLRAYTRAIVDKMVATGEASTFIPVLALLFAVNPTEVGIAHEPRAAGSTKYSFYKLMRYNFDLITNFSVVPLEIFTFIGICVSFFSIIFFIFLLVRRLLIGPEASGLFTLFAIAFFIMGLILLGLGIVGEYIGRIYHETLKRPRFVIRNILQQQSTTDQS